MEATSDRVPWSEVPPEVIAQVSELLGSPVAEVADQRTGYSPGTAARVGTSTGRRAFVKGAPERLGRAAELYRREARVLELLPAGVPAPRLLGTVSVAAAGDSWFALVTEEVAGRHPAVPPERSDLVSMLDVVAAAPHARGLPLPELTGELEVDVWPALSDRHGDSLSPVERDNARRLDALAREATAGLAGDRLVHLDTRSDNVLFDAGGRVWLVDWAWACVGASWIDGLTTLLDARLNGSPDTDALLAHPAFDGVPARAVDALLAALVGGFRLNSFQPAPPRMPALRGFQAAQADVALDWLLARGALG